MNSLNFKHFMSRRVFEIDLNTTKHISENISNILSPIFYEKLRGQSISIVGILNKSKGMEVQTPIFIERLRQLLNASALECDLQRCVLDSGFLNSIFDVESEITIPNNEIDGKRFGIRLDGILFDKASGVCHILEFKRRNHSLLLKKNPGTQSKKMRLSNNQLIKYRKCLAVTSAIDILKAKVKSDIKKIDYYLIAGDNFDNLLNERLLYPPEGIQFDYHIFSWSGFLSFLDRVVKIR